VAAVTSVDLVGLVREHLESASPDVLVQWGGDIKVRWSERRWSVPWGQAC
jgi:hypothetical protein